MPRLQSFADMGINLNSIYTLDDVQYPYIVTWYDQDTDQWVKQVFDLAADSRLFATMLYNKRRAIDILVWNPESKGYNRVGIHAWLFSYVAKPLKHTMQ